MLYSRVGGRAGVNRIINDKTRHLSVIPLAGCLAKSVHNSRYKPYSEKSDFQTFNIKDGKQSYGKVIFYDEYGI